jgi:thioredoxin-like negative regulator of GroEL
MASSPRIEELRKKFEENPRRYFAPLANEYRKAGDIEQAIAICREYLPQQPGHMSGHIVYGQALYEARQVDEAKSVFETALSLDPENLIALRHLGDIALMIGDAPGARMWYGRVLEADPRNEEIQAQLARLDQTESTPTPVVSPQVESTEPPPEPTPAAAAPALAAASKPTPSSAPTVVVSAMRVPPTPNEEPVDRPLETVPPQRDPLDQAITLERAAIPAPHIEQSPDSPIGLEPTSKATGENFGSQATLPIDVSMVEHMARQREAPPIESFSLEGLETTSMAPEKAPPEATATASAPPPDQPPVVSELTLAAVAAAAAPEPAASEPPPAPEAPEAPEVPTLELADIPVEAPATPAVTPAAEVAAPAAERTAPVSQSGPTDDLPLLDLPLLDIGELPATRATEPEPVSQPAPEPATEPVTELALDATAPESGPFVTETMAELYLHQGHYEEALRVYRALLEQRPGDQRLQAKIESLLAMPAAPEAAPSPAAARTFAPVAPTGRTIRDVLTSIAVRRPSGTMTAHVENGGTQPEPPPSSAAPTPSQEGKPRPADRLANLFGVVDTSPGDESAAMVLSQAFTELNGLEHGRGEVSGAPAHPANSELSLDAVFKGDGPEKPAPSTFSFDQFFSQRATTEHPTATSGTTAETAAKDDATQFTQWLEGLKQR